MRCGETFVASNDPLAVDDSSGVQKAAAVAWVQPKSWPAGFSTPHLREGEAAVLPLPYRQQPSRLIVPSVVALIAIVGAGSLAAWWFLSHQEPNPSVTRPGGPVIGIAQIQNGPPVPAPLGPGGPLLIGAPALRYRWKDGPHVYDVHIQAEKDDYFEIHEGHCTVSVDKNAPPRGPAAAAEERKGTGTAFVVHADGYLLTCAHVVAGAVKIEVVLGRTYEATVIALDPANDLALIQIAARNLPTLPLARSDTAKVGQGVWALGFPLTGLLGDKLKMNHGTLTGVDFKAGPKGLQNSTGINSGNSGGPLVSETGAVLGVNSAKLVGDGIANVGFATPINEAKRLLLIGKEMKFLPEAAGAAKLDGPALYERVKPAVAFVRVTLGPRTDGDTFKLTCRPRLSQHQKAKPGIILRPGPPSIGGLGGSDCHLEMKANGEIAKASGGNQLPYLLGELGHFLIEPLPPDNRPAWETKGSCTLEKGIGGLPRMPLGPRFSPRPPVPAGPKATRQAQERSDYTRGAAAGDTITIQKRYELKVDAADGDPALTLSLEGSITFDIEKGLPRAIDLQGTFNDGKRPWPFTVTYKLLEGEARERVLNPPREEPKPLTDPELTQALVDLQGAGRRAALDRLAKALPTAARRQEVAGTLEPILADPDLFTRQAAVKALAVWGIKDNVPALLKMLEDKNLFVRIETMAALGKLQDERAAGPLAQRLASHEDRVQASKALQALGAAAEKAVIPLLGNAEWFIRLEACKILKVIGTKESKAALEAAVRDPNSLVAAAAKEAAAAVAARP